MHGKPRANMLSEHVRVSIPVRGTGCMFCTTYIILPRLLCLNPREGYGMHVLLLTHNDMDGGLNPREGYGMHAPTEEPTVHVQSQSP